MSAAHDSASSSDRRLRKLRLVATGMLVCVAAFLILVPAVSAAAPEKHGQLANAPPPSPQRLWSEFPLNARTSKSAIRPRHLSVVETPRAPPAQPQRSEGSGPSSLALVLIAALLASLAAAGLLLQRAGPGRVVRSLSRGKGGDMPQFVRRIVGRDRSEEEDATASGVEMVRAYVDTQRSERMKTQSESDVEEASVVDETAEPDYAQLGYEVTTILKSAQEAATGMRQKAQEEAERIQAEAAATAGAMTHEANRLLEEAQAHLDEQRVAAEQQAREIRRTADAYAEETRKDAELDASRIVAAAEQRAKELEAGARGRRDSLIAEADALQEHFQQLIPEFRQLTTRLDVLLATKPERVEMAADDPEPSLEEALRRSGGAAQAPVG
jgi:hypothetical protein